VRVGREFAGRRFLVGLLVWGCCLVGVVVGRGTDGREELGRVGRLDGRQVVGFGEVDLGFLSGLSE
jgi:hypothetical protein